MTALRLGSLFDGIGVFPLAAVRCGIEPIWASEIEKAPISITKRHFPDMVHLGDVTKLDGRDLPPVHIISWADMYDSASMESKKMIVSCLIRRVEVYRDYRLHIDFNIDFEQFSAGLDISAIAA